MADASRCCTGAGDDPCTVGRTACLDAAHARGISTTQLVLTWEAWCRLDGFQRTVNTDSGMETLDKRLESYIIIRGTTYIAHDLVTAHSHNLNGVGIGADFSSRLAAATC